MKKALFIFFACWNIAIAQVPDSIYAPNILSTKLLVQGSQTAQPIIALGAAQVLELHFDDADAFVKNYSYTFQLCNANWEPAMLSTFDYLKGFSQVRINQYRASSVALTRYIHYQASLPDKNCMPTKSGNYLLKIFLNGDTTQLVFTKRILIADQKVNIGVQIQPPFNNQLFKTHQKVQFSIDKKQLNIINPQQQVQVVVYQNGLWKNGVRLLQPVFIRNNVYEYNGELDALFPGLREYRWVDLRSFRFQSDRVKHIQKLVDGWEIEVVDDAPITQQRYVFNDDFNGYSQIITTELINNWWQTDYAKVKFKFIPPNYQAYANQQLYLIGELTNFQISDAAKMDYNAAKGIYEKEVFLKQGYYSYNYILQPSITSQKINYQNVDGNFWETENEYTILVYYRALNGRHDELVGFSVTNTRNRNF